MQDFENAPLDVRACARNHYAFTLGEPDGTLSRVRMRAERDAGHPWRRFIWSASGVRTAALRAVMRYADENGGTVFDPSGEPLFDSGPIRWRP